MAPARILIVDDTSTNIDILRAVLAGLDCQIAVATDGERALKLVERTTPDLILLDIMMPGIDGFEVCRRLKSHSKTKAIPIVFVTACADDVSKGFDIGGEDYITKPINANEVVARVSHQLEKHKLLNQLHELNATLEQKVKERTAALAISNRQLREEVRERRYMQDRMQYLASHDFITKLYSRTALDEKVTLTIANIQLDNFQSVFLFIDIDQFRIINENCGCIAGDELLRQFAELISGLCTNFTFFARVGGDKFGLVYDYANKQEGLKLADAIHAAINDYEFSWEGQAFDLAATIALVEITHEVINFDQLMMIADDALHVAKKQSRNSTLYYGAEMENSPFSRKKNIDWGLRLVNAIKNNHFRLHFQQLHYLGKSESGIDNNKHQLKIEVLFRLLDFESNTLVLPGDFIPAAEYLNLITPIDRWVISHAIEFLAENRDMHGYIYDVAINISALSLCDSTFIEYIIFTLEAHNIPGNLICIEVTETESIANMELADAQLKRLKEAGCSLAIDDFGSGFSSFNYLRLLPFDTVKIDGVFIKDMDVNQSHQGMVRSITEIARQMGKEVVAEFVETVNIEKQVKLLEIEWGQGYYYNKPVELSATSLRSAVVSCGNTVSLK